MGKRAAMCTQQRRGLLLFLLSSSPDTERQMRFSPPSLSPSSSVALVSRVSLLASAKAPSFLPSPSPSPPPPSYCICRRRRHLLLNRTLIPTLPLSFISTSGEHTIGRKPGNRDNCYKRKADEKG